MRAVLLALALVQGLTLAAHAATDDELRQKIVGKWGPTATCSDGSLVFNADGSFSSEKDGAQLLKGTYDVTDGKLNGKVDGDSMPEMTVSFDDDALVLAGGGTAPQRLARCS